MNQTIYFRKQVWQTFQDEPDKSKLVNDLLERHYAGGAMLASPVTTGAPGPVYVSKVELPGPKEEVFVPKPPDPEIGYPCCSKAQPCKHWSYDGNLGLWVNELTGKTREVSQ